MGVFISILVGGDMQVREVAGLVGSHTRALCILG